MKKINFISFILLLFTSCSNASLQAQNSPLTKNSLKKFSSEQAFEKYAQQILKYREIEYQEQEKERKKYQAKMNEKPLKEGLSSPMAAPSTLAGEAKADKFESENQSITNNQELGVDEGDIVKAYKDYLIVLRRGRIFSLKVGQKQDQKLNFISYANVSPEGYKGGGWYDEMLISENKILVVGYSYAMRATELALFTLSEKGSIEYQKTYFVDSNDYYSSRNYASRLVGGKLVFYMPYYLFDWGYRPNMKAHLPQIKEWLKENKASEGKNILEKTDIFEPIQSSLYPTLHMVVSCDWTDNALKCSGKGVLGPYSRNFYVSSSNIYLWVSKESSYRQKYMPEIKNESPAVAYKISLSDPNSFEALLAKGSPIDQFSFKESKGYLNLLLQSSRGSDGMWDPEFTDGNLSFLRVPLSEFSTSPKNADTKFYSPLSRPKGYNIQNRFVGNHLLYGPAGEWWYNNTEDTRDKRIFIKNILNKEKPQIISLNHSVDRIEIMGPRAVVIGSNKNDLHFSSFDLEEKAFLLGTYIEKGSAQSESRSHGFFFKANANGKGGILGLPTEGNSKLDRYFGGSAEVLFLNVDAQAKFKKIGSLSAKEKANGNDNCKVSCVDWYGNSRPIFWGNKIFALLGYELIEGNLENNSSLKEKQRIHFMPIR